MLLLLPILLFTAFLTLIPSVSVSFVCFCVYLYPPHAYARSRLEKKFRPRARAYNLKQKFSVSVSVKVYLFAFFKTLMCRITRCTHVGPPTKKKQKKTMHKKWSGKNMCHFFTAFPLLFDKPSKNLTMSKTLPNPFPRSSK